MSKSLKTRLSSDWSLQFDSMKLESLVIGGQLYAGEYVLGSCTHCPSRQQSWSHLKSHENGPKLEPVMRMKSCKWSVATCGSNSAKKLG